LAINKSAITYPGPGAYGTPNKILKYKDSPSWRLGQSKRKDLSDSQSKLVPAPGVYNMQTKIGEGPKY